MKRLLFLLVTFTALLPVHAEKPAWVCAIEWSEEKPEWVFVYEDVKLQADGVIEYSSSGSLPMTPKSRWQNKLGLSRPTSTW